MNYTRYDTYEDIVKSGFDLKLCAQKLENELFALLEE